MDLTYLQDIYINNIDRMFEVDNFEHIANHSNDIQGYSFLNRMLIYMQNKYSTKVKSRESWISDGYMVKPDSTPLGIISPVIETKYYSTDDGAEIGIHELSISEFSKAVKLGVVNKQVDVKSLKCTLVFDIDNVYKIGDKSNVDKPRNIRLSSLYKLLNSIGIIIDRGEGYSSSYDEHNNTLLIGNDNIECKIICCMEALTKYILGSAFKNIGLSDYDYKLARDYSAHSIMTYFNIESHINFDYIHNMYCDYKQMESKVDTIVEILDSIEDILNTKVFSSNQISSSEEHKNFIMSRASTLLTILEASYEAFKIKGV